MSLNRKSWGQMSGHGSWGTAAMVGLALALAPASVFFGAPTTAAAAAAADPDADYDRLDGMGKSGKKVQVIEWEGNLEIHAYPHGSLKGLALKLDLRNKAKPVMVIGYRFNDSPKTQLIRRAILGIDLQEGFKTYRDPGEKEFDKILISNNGLSDGVLAYQLEAEPTQLYPDGHPLLAGAGGTAAAAVGASAGAVENRKPATKGAEDRAGGESVKESLDEETGTIQPFYMKSDRVMNRK